MITRKQKLMLIAGYGIVFLLALFSYRYSTLYGYQANNTVLLSSTGLVAFIGYFFFFVKRKKGKLQRSILRTLSK